MKLWIVKTLATVEIVAHTENTRGTNDKLHLLAGAQFNLVLFRWVLDHAQKHLTNASQGTKKRPAGYSRDSYQSEAIGRRSAVSRCIRLELGL